MQNYRQPPFIHGLASPPATPPPEQQQQQQQLHLETSRSVPRPLLFAPIRPEARIDTILESRLILRTIIGTGAYGVVYLAEDLHYPGIWYAVKALNKYNADGTPLDKRQKEFQDKEIALHYAASKHPNVVSMWRVVDHSECTYVVLEYCPEGDLFSNITERGRYVGNDANIRRAFLQILDAVEHCHDMGVYHRDLKPENILVSQGGKQVLLADFGLATRDSQSEDHGCGSTFYMSPECLDQSPRKRYYRCAANDVWSLGVILVNLTCGRNPWKQASAQDSTYRAFTRNPDFLKTILPLSDDLARILGMIFERDPAKRITVDALKVSILRCRSFSAQPQPITPPQSPLAFPPRDDDSISICSSEGSLDSSMSDSTGSDSDFEALDSPVPEVRECLTAVCEACDAIHEEEGVCLGYQSGYQARPDIQHSLFQQHVQQQRGKRMPDVPSHQAYGPPAAHAFQPNLWSQYSKASPTSYLFWMQQCELVYSLPHNAALQHPYVFPHTVPACC